MSAYPDGVTAASFHPGRTADETVELMQRAEDLAGEAFDDCHPDVAAWLRDADTYPLYDLIFAFTCAAIHAEFNGDVRGCRAKAYDALRQQWVETNADRYLWKAEQQAYERSEE